MCVLQERKDHCPDPRQPPFINRGEDLFDPLPHAVFKFTERIERRPKGVPPAANLHA